MPKNIIIENTVCSNTGDGAIMLAAVKILRVAISDDIKIDIFDQEPESAGTLYPAFKMYPLLMDQLFKVRLGATKLQRLISKADNIKSWIAVWTIKHHMSFLSKFLIGREKTSLIQIYNNADLIMTTGGTYLVENYDLKIKRCALQFRLNQFLNKPLILFTQSLGPYAKQDNITSLRPVLHKSPLILLRDKASYENLEPVLNDRSQCHVVADSVFALAETDRIEAFLKEDTSTQKAPKNIAISVREWPHFKNQSAANGMAKYKKSIAALSEHFVSKHNANITFISTCQGLSDYRYDDSTVAQDICDSLPTDIQKNITVNSNYHGPTEIMDILRDMDLTVATRMHMMIMSLCVGTPVLPISYEFKTTELSNDMQLGNILSDIEDITPDDIIAKADLLFDNFNELKTLALQETLIQYNSAMQAVPLIRRALDLPPQSDESPATVHDNKAPSNASKTVSSLAA